MSGAKVEVVLRLLSMAVAPVLLVTIWTQPVLHFYVDVAPPSDELIEVSRLTPSAALLAHDVIFAELIPGTTPAREDLAGLAKTFKESFNLDHQDHIGGLEYASFHVADVFMRTFEITKDNSYLDLTATFINSFSQYERSQWFNKGMLWNDHAIAARVGVVARFWKSYRQSDSFDREIAREVILHLNRCIEFLTRTSHFTVATNHGVMQNLALLQSALAFPLVGDAQYRAQVAVGRLEKQYEFLVNSEGIVMEHSASYHIHGIHMLQIAIKLATLSGSNIPPEWHEKLDAVRKYRQIIVRPNGTLPAYGDTGVHEQYLFEPQSPDGSKSLHLFPVAGYGIWTHQPPDNPMSLHATAAWSYFPGLGHKHADEMSVQIYGNNKTLITGSGYWPYTDSRRISAVGWRSSNAPHWQGEDSRSQRVTTLETYTQTPHTIAMHLRRINGDGRQLARQFVSSPNGKLIVVDTSQSAADVPSSRFDVVWTFAPELTLKRLRKHTYELNDRRDKSTLRVWVSPNVAVSQTKGSNDPFAGWVASTNAGPILPTPALELNSLSANGHSITLFDTAPGDDSPESVEFDFIDESAWAVQGVDWSISRMGQIIRLTTDTSSTESKLIEAPNTDQQRKSLVEQVAAAKLDYPHYRNLNFYRTRLSFAALAGIAIHILGVYFIRRLGANKTTMISTHALALICWISVSYWGIWIYLV